MSSLIRRQQRKAARVKAGYEAKPQPVSIERDGGYVTIRYTKGYRRVSGRRVRAQLAMASMLDHGRVFRPATKRPKNDNQAYRKSIWPAAKVARMQGCR